MNAKLIIQTRIDELDAELQTVVVQLKSRQAPGGAPMSSMKQNFEEISKYKDQILGLRSAIAELKNIKELV
jgi:hypothetical protein